MKHLAKRLVIFLSVIILPTSLYSCVCAPITLGDRVEMSDFIAKAKILSVLPDPNDKDYHFIKVKLYEVFKGPKVTQLKIYSASMSSCAFFTPENSKWLIFASYDKNKNLVFNQCSGAKQIDKKYNSAEFPKLEEIIKQKINLKIKVLKTLRKNDLMQTNPAKLNYTLLDGTQDTLEHFDGIKTDFSIREYTLNSDLSINSIKEVKGFKNLKLNQKLSELLKTHLRIYSTKTKTVESGTKLYIITYFYPPKENNPSFISLFDV